MKLLYLHQYFSFPEQSAGTRSYDLATSFVRKGYEVIVIGSDFNVTKGEKRRWNIYQRDGITFYMLNCPYDNSMTFVNRIKSFLRFMWFASFQSLRIKCDCVLATSTPLTIAVPALIKKWFTGTPFIFEVRDVWPEVPIKLGFIKNKIAIKFLYWFEKMVYKNSSVIVPLSEGMDNNIKLRYPNNKSVIIHNISEINRFSKITSSVELPLCATGKKIVLYAGTFGHVNGLKYVIDLASETSKIDKTIIFLLFGKGKEKPEVIEYAQKKGLLNSIVYICEPVSKQELPYLYSIATVGSSYVIDNPVLWDNSANKFFDTLAAAKPIVINHNGWQASAIRKYKMGFVLPPIITSESVKDFVSYMNNQEELLQQGNRAFEIAKSNYSLEVAVDKYIAILKKIEQQKYV